MELFNQDKKDEAMYWFYLGQLRARYDANLCTDKSAAEKVGQLNQKYGPTINPHALKDIDKLEGVVTKVIDFIRNNEELYDHRWISLHGLNAMIAGMDGKSDGKEIIKPKGKWKDIKTKTIDDYYKGFVKYILSNKEKIEKEANE